MPLPNASPMSVEAVLLEFDKRRETLASLCEKTKDLIEECLQDANIRYQSVQARVKTSKKLREKYSNPDKKYKCLDDITDLVGLRIITYYEDEVDRVAGIIEREFQIDPENSVDKRNTDPDRFGYHAVNFVCRHTEKRRSDVPYKKFGSTCCEVQVTSILRHAWSEIEHDWYDLREAFPSDIKRRFYRMAALLEIAESEFLELRKKKGNYFKSVDLQVEAQVSGVPLNSVSLKSFISQDPIVERIDKVLVGLTGSQWAGEISDEFLSRRCEIARKVGINTIEEIREALVKYELGISKYFARCLKFWDTLAPLPQGVCVFNLITMIAISREVDLSSIIEGWADHQFSDYWSKQIEAAKEVVAEYS